MRPAFLVALVLSLSAATGAQTSTARDVRIDGRSIVGRWRAIAVVGDEAATADLRRGDLSTVLVVNPTGHAILRGVDRREGLGRPAQFTGRVVRGRLVLRGLDGSAALALLGARLHLVAPSGRRTVFRRDR